MEEVTVFSTLEEAVMELRKRPEARVIAHCDDLDIELRAVGPRPASGALGDALAALGPWEGESTAELLDRLREARLAGTCDEPPAL